MLLLLCCLPPEEVSAASSSHFVIHGATVVGVGPRELEVDRGRVVGLGPVSAGLPTVDYRGLYLVPAFIDSHVHLAYLPEASALAAGGIAAAVDLASPLPFLSEDPSPLRLLRSGPMLTAPNGYPTLGWGRNGYGYPCPDAASAKKAAETLIASGATVLKLPLDDGPRLSDAAIRAIVSTAHTHGLKVATHALSDAYALEAAQLEIDVLAHTPVEPLRASTLRAWNGHAVISTLAAFGGSSSTLENLRQLHASGTTVLYGTDFGNTRETGISLEEIQLLQKAGLSGAEILAAGTSAPANYWGFSELGSLDPGKSASFLVVAQDPLQHPETLAAPVAVYLDGVGQ